MLHYDRIDVSEGMDANKTSAYYLSLPVFFRSRI